MAISRPLLIALVGVIVLFAVVMAVRVVGAQQGAASGSTGSSQVASSSTSASSSPVGTKVGAGSGGARNAGPRHPAPAGSRDGSNHSDSAGAGVPGKVAQALDQHKVVVLFFGGQGHDDRATRDAAESVRGPDTAVFVDSPYHLEDYARVVGALPITQLPSTVVIDRHRKARVVEGFADAGSLRQLVDDAR